jgi:hypothetical protein
LILDIFNEVLFILRGTKLLGRRFIFAGEPGSFVLTIGNLRARLTMTLEKPYNGNKSGFGAV